MTNDSRLTSIFYNDPYQYPPIINSTWLLAEAGYLVDLYCRQAQKEWQVPLPVSTSLFPVGNQMLSSWREYLAFVRKVLTSARPSRLYFGHDMHGFLVARLLATRYKRPLIYHCHDFVEANTPLPFGGRTVKSFESRFARTADMVIVPDAERAEIVARQLQLSKAPLVVANGPRKNQPIGSNMLEKALSERGYHFSNIVWRQGRIGEGHALEMTIRSIPLWDNSEWGFVIMGVGEVAYADHLYHIAREADVHDRFVILPAVRYAAVAQFTVGAQVGHALYEPTHINNRFITTASNKLMEYMSAGLPLLVSDRPSLRQFTGRYECGIVADEQSPHSIAIAVNQLLTDPQRARTLGSAGRDAFQEQFSYDKQFDSVLYYIKAKS